MSDYKPNPELYAALSQPVASDEARQRLIAFCDAVAALRTEHKIPELMFVAGAWERDGTQPTELAVSYGHYGNVNHAPELAKLLYETTAVTYVDRMLKK
jgi:hypothetical protein